MRSRHELEVVGNGRSTPDLIERRGSSRMRCSSIAIEDPSPLQEGHAPYGLLNENSRGEISARLVPQSAQA